MSNEFINILVILPIILPVLTAILQVFVHKNLTVVRSVNTFSAFLLILVAALILTAVHQEKVIAITLGSWEAPFGISFVIDYFAAIMLLISSIIFSATAIYSLGSIHIEREKYYFYPLTQILMLGINGSFLTGDLFNLFVWFEVMLISSFVLMSLGGKKAQLEGALKYVVINLISSAIFLSATGMLFGITGSLNMADLAYKISHMPDNGMLNVVAMLFLVAFGIKSAIFPMFFWLPASYHTPPSPVTALLAGLLTKVGVYVIFRVFTLIFIQDVEFTHTVLLILSGLTMLIGVLGPIAQNDFRRILSFHIVSQVGYMIMALALFSPLAIAGGIFYIVHHMVVKTNLFIISGVTKSIKGSYELEKLGGLYKLYPFLGLLFIISAFSLAGIPPLSGFWAKFILTKAGFTIEQYFIIGLSLFVGLLTLFSMSKIWTQVFWKNDPNENSDRDDFKSLPIRKKYLLFAPMIYLAGITLFISFGVDYVFEFATLAAEQLKEPSIYINAVLGGGK
jgi:multicomponent Na+:H+ antiporter subunit D